MVGTLIRNLVQGDCARDENIFGASFFDEHIAVVAEYAANLAAILGADRAIVELAAYLHDLSAVRDASTLPNHASASAQLAAQLLSERGCSPEIVDAVARCVVTHSSPIPLGGGTSEEVCISNADAMAQIARPAYWSYYVFGVRKQPFEDGCLWLRRLYQTKWDSLIPPARDLIRNRVALTEELIFPARPAVLL